MEKLVTVKKQSIFGSGLPISFLRPDMVKLLSLRTDTLLIERFIPTEVSPIAEAVRLTFRVWKTYRSQ